jgi:DNA-binding GntR family transcriptional regulator
MLYSIGILEEGKCMQLRSGRKKNQYEYAYLTIKDAIINGELEPGYKLTEAKIAERLQSSRTPVREALRKLEIEGLVVCFPAQGAEVAPLNHDSMVHLYECRAVLEGLAAKKAVETITDQELTGLEESIFLTRQYFLVGQLEKVVAKNTLFHDIIIQSSGNTSLIMMMDQVRTQILRFRKLTSNIGFRASFADEHEEIYQALSRKDGERAEMLMKQHVINDLQYIKKSL